MKSRPIGAFQITAPVFKPIHGQLGKALLALRHNDPRATPSDFGRRRFWPSSLADKFIGQWAIDIPDDGMVTILSNVLSGSRDRMNFPIASKGCHCFLGAHTLAAGSFQVIA